MSQLNLIPDDESLRAANINPATLLATDYLNHFNEVLMLIEMLPMMPECAEDIFAWRPMNYIDYFTHSTFKEKRLAIDVYCWVDPDICERFETLIAEINDKVFHLIEEISAMGAEIDPQAFESLAFLASTEIRPLIDKVSALVNNKVESMDWMLAVDHPTAQDEVDLLFD